MSTAAVPEIARNHQLESRANIRSRPDELPGKRPHGYARYRLDGCRCYVCGLARAAYDDHRNKRIAYGRWQPFTSLTRAQAQIRALREAGYGDRSIAALAGVNRKIIRDIRLGVRHDPSRDNPPLTKIRTETEAAVLAVPLDRLNLPGGATVDATTTWTQIHALIALGYPRAWIAAEIGHGRTLQLGRQRLTVRNAKAVHELYWQVGDRPGPSERARLEGQRNGWLTPIHLDLDDAAETMESRRQSVVEEVQHLIGTDTAHAIAKRLGYAGAASLTRTLERWERGDLARRLESSA